MSVDKNQFEQLIRCIVTEHFPLELEAFEADPGGAINDVMEQARGQVARSPLESEMGFPEGTALLGFMSAALATYQVALSVGRNPPRASPEIMEKLYEQWLTALIEHGLTREEASAIATRFKNDLFKVIKVKE